MDAILERNENQVFNGSRELEKQIEDLRDKVLWISGHITVATELLNRIHDPHKIIDEELFLSSLSLISEKAKELEKEVYFELDKISADLSLQKISEL